MKKEMENKDLDMPMLEFTDIDEVFLTGQEIEEIPTAQEEDLLPVHSDTDQELEFAVEHDVALVAEEIPSEEEEDVQELPKRNWRKSILTFAHDVLYLLAVLILVSLVLRVVVVDGTSMTNTLKDGDYILVLSNVLYRNPKQGDIIVASKESFENGAPIVKRVIATEGQTVDIDFNKGIVYVDGIALDEPYTKTPTTLQEGVSFPLVVDEGCIFVLGDNRNGSRDSRSPDIGLIKQKEVIGKVVFLFLPGTNGTNVFGEPNEPRDFSRIGVPE